RFAVAGDVSEGGRFVVGGFEYNMLLPGPIDPFGIFKPGGLFAGKSNDQDVVPAILVEVDAKSEKVIRIGIVDTQRAFESFDGLFASIGLFVFEGPRRRIIFVTLFKIGSFVPIRAGNDVHFSIVVKIAESRAFTPKLVAQLRFLEGMNA